MKNMIVKTALVFVAAAFLSVSCSDEFFDKAPTSSVAEGNIFTTTENAMLAVNGIHRLMHEGGSSGTTTSWNSQGGYTGWCIHLAVMSDDVMFTYASAMHQNSAEWVRHHDLTQKYLDPNYYWKFFYRVIANCNKIFEQIDDLPGSDSYRYFVKGQAYAYRSFSHFQLVQGWAERYDWNKTKNDQKGVILRTDTFNENQPRATVEDTYKLILADIDSAIFYLEKVPASITSSYNKSHITQWVAKGIKARVLLTMGRWADAATVAQDVVDHSGAALQSNTYTVTTHRMVDMTNTEWLWGEKGAGDFDKSQHDYTREFLQFFANCGTSYARNTPKAINSLLWKSIPATDVRKACWVEDPYAVKASLFLPSGAAAICPYMSQKWILADNSTLDAVEDWSYMRLPEIMMIAAEGYVRSGVAANVTKAQALVQQLGQQRDPAYAAVTETGDALIEKIMWQRRVELWGEAGLRWYDLKRLDLECNRGPAPGAGYNQGGNTNGWGVNATVMPTNLDPNASNFNMYDGCLKETSRVIAKPSVNANMWNWAIPTQETSANPLCEPNEL